MNYILMLFLGLTICGQVYGQKTYEEWIQEGIYESNKFPQPDLASAEKAYREALKLNPKGFEAYFRLGRLYEKKYLPDAEAISDLRLEQTKQIASFFDQAATLHLSDSALAISASYFPDLDYSTIWSKLALKYANYRKEDSLRWALGEMRKKHFYPVLLEMSKNILSEVQKDGILFINSEIMYAYILYAQIIEGFRKDIVPMNVSYCQAVWYILWIQDKYFPTLYLSRDDIESKGQTEFYEDLEVKDWQSDNGATIVASHVGQVRREEWFMGYVLSHIRKPFYALASYENNLMRAIKVHWSAVGLTKRFFAVVNETPIDELIQNAKQWQTTELKALKGTFPTPKLFEMLQYYRLPFILYAYNHMNSHREITQSCIATIKEVLPEEVLPMKKDIKQFFMQIEQFLKQ